MDYQQAIEFVFYIIENKLLTNSIDMSTNPYIPNKSKGVGAKLIIELSMMMKKQLIKKLPT